jgi:hypothetical protein
MKRAAAPRLSIVTALALLCFTSVSMLADNEANAFTVDQEETLVAAAMCNALLDIKNWLGPADAAGITGIKRLIAKPVAEIEEATDQDVQDFMARPYRRFLDVYTSAADSVAYNEESGKLLKNALLICANRFITAA